jgi:hypothetical protein
MKSENEERDAAAEAPLRDDLVHEEDEIAADAELGDDHGAGDAEAVAAPPAVEHGLRVRVGLKEAEHLRDGLDEDHDDDQDLLGSLVDRLVLAVREVELDDLRADEQLHDDAARDDGADAQVHERSALSGEDRAEGGEDVELRPEAVDVDVREDEVGQKGGEAPQQLGAEVDVALRLGDGRPPLDQRLQFVQKRLPLFQTSVLPGDGTDPDFHWAI